MALQIVSPLRAFQASEALLRRIVAIYHLLLMWRVFAIFAAVATLSIVAPRTSFAQVAARPQAVGVLQFMASPPDNQPTAIYGLDASAEIKSVHFWGFRGDISGQRWNSYATRYFAGLGPQLSFGHQRVIFHADALLGASRNRVWVPPPPPPAIVHPANSEDAHGYYSSPQTSFAVRAGGGVDLRLSRHWMLRAVEVSVTNSFATHTVHSVEFSSGIACVF